MANAEVSQKVAAGPDLLLGHGGHVKHPSRTVGAQCASSAQDGTRRAASCEQQVGLRTPAGPIVPLRLVAVDRGG